MLFTTTSESQESLVSIRVTWESSTRLGRLTAVLLTTAVFTLVFVVTGEASDLTDQQLVTQTGNPRYGLRAAASAELLERLLVDPRVFEPIRLALDSPDTSPESIVRLRRIECLYFHHIYDGYFVETQREVPGQSRPLIGRVTPDVYHTFLLPRCGIWSLPGYLRYPDPQDPLRDVAFEHFRRGVQELDSHFDYPTAPDVLNDIIASRYALHSYMYEWLHSGKNPLELIPIIDRMRQFEEHENTLIRDILCKVEFSGYIKTTSIPPSIEDRLNTLHILSLRETPVPSDFEFSRYPLDSEVYLHSSDLKHEEGEGQ